MSSSSSWNGRARSRLLACTLAACCAALPPVAQAGWRDDAHLQALVGEGEAHFWGLRLYRARLWSGVGGFDPRRPFALELTYLRPVRRERIVQASIDEIRRIAGAAVPAQRLEGWRELLERTFVDVDAGETVTGEYRPDQGVRFYRGERLLADIPDADFARAFFRIWLDENTREPRLREQLLGVTR